jgi:hypothetical protein
MRAEVIKGQLIYVDTEEAMIQINDKDDGKVIDLNVGTDTTLPAAYSWARLIGTDIEVIVIDGRTKHVYPLAE